jgi:hypothetical protein
LLCCKVQIYVSDIGVSSFPFPIQHIVERVRKELEKKKENKIGRDTENNVDDNPATERTIFTYNNGNPPLNMWLRQAKKCLLKNDKAKNLGENIQICFSQPQNLKRIATQPNKSKPKESEAGCAKCGKCRVSCPVLKEGKFFTSTNTERTYPIRQKLTCNSSYVIYLATCKKLRRGNTDLKGDSFSPNRRKEEVGRTETIFKLKLRA